MHLRGWTEYNREQYQSKIQSLGWIRTWGFPYTNPKLLFVALKILRTVLRAGEKHTVRAIRHWYRECRRVFPQVKVIFEHLALR
jgi:hypothetical protein